MSDKHPIRNNVIGTVVGGMILACLGALWPPATAFFRWLFALLSSAVPVPVWTILVALGLVAVLTFRSVRRPPPALPVSGVNAIDASTPPIALTAPVSSLEKSILEQLVRADGNPVTFNALIAATGVARLRLQTELERLQANALVEILSVPEEDDAHVFLSSRGRQYLLQLGLM